MIHKKPWRGCLACKQIYVRCDGGRPICRNCIKYHRVCEYSTSQDTKGPQPLQATHTPASARRPSNSQSQTLLAMSGDSASNTTVTSTSIPRSLDPYPQSLLPLTPAKRALLAFCKRHIMPCSTSLTQLVVWLLTDLLHRYRGNNSRGLPNPRRESGMEPNSHSASIPRARFAACAPGNYIQHSQAEECQALRPQERLYRAPDP